MKLQTTNYKLLTRQKGFTLIEMLVVIFITAIIATISIANFRAGEKQKRVALATDTIVNAIRYAQNNALTGKKTNNANTACRTPLYYYAYFNYSGVMYLGAANNCATDDLIENYTLPANTRIKAASIKVNGSSGNNFVAIYFKPPYAKMTAYGNITPFDTNFNTITISVESADGTISKTVTVDGISGRIGE